MPEARSSLTAELVADGTEGKLKFWGSSGSGVMYLTFLGVATDVGNQDAA